MLFLTCLWIISLCIVQATNYQVATGLQGRNGAVYAPDSLQGLLPGDTIEFILIGVNMHRRMKN